MNLVERVTTAKATRNWALFASAIPYAQFTGISAHVDENTDELIGTLKFAPHLIGNSGIPALHGGVIGAFLESTAIFALLWEAETVVLPRIVTITVDYLRTGHAVDTFARGTITRQGRRVASVFVEAWQDDRQKPIATANAHLLITPPED